MEDEDMKVSRATLYEILNCLNGILVADGSSLQERNKAIKIVKDTLAKADSKS